MTRSAAAPSGSPVPASCFCGAVRFDVRPPTRFCIHCHCSMCRRNHTAAFVTWVGVPRSQLTVTAGEELLTRFRSSEHGSRSFCSRCGSSLFCVLDHEPDTIDVPLAAFHGPIDRSPEAHVFFDDRVEWGASSDELPKIGKVGG